MRASMHRWRVFLPGALLLPMCSPVVWGSEEVDTSDLDSIFFSNAGPADYMQALGLKDFIDDDHPGPANMPGGSASQPAPRGGARPAPPVPKKKAPAPPAPPSTPASPPTQTGSEPTGGAWSAVKQLASGAAHLAQDVAHGTAHAAQNVMKATHTAPRTDDASRQADIKAAQERAAAKRRAETAKRSKQAAPEPVILAPESNCSIYERRVCNHFEKQFIINQRKDTLEKAHAELAHWEGEIARGVTQTPHGQMRYSTMVRIVKEIIAYIEKHGGEKTKQDIDTDKLEL